MSVSRPTVDVLNAVLAATPDDIQSASTGSNSKDDDDFKRLFSRYFSPRPDGRALFDIRYFDKTKRRVKALLRKNDKKEALRLLRQVERWELRGDNAPTPDYVTPVPSLTTTALVDLTKDIEVIDVENPRHHLRRQGQQIQHYSFQSLGGAPLEGSTVTYSAQYGPEATQRHAEAWQRRNETRKINARKKLDEAVAAKKKAEAAKHKPKAAKPKAAKPKAKGTLV